MVREVVLKPGWLNLDMEKAAERVREWTRDQNSDSVNSDAQTALSASPPVQNVERR